jgi:phosphatidylglycerophosphatase A
MRLSSIAMALATGLGVGHVPYAPGTFGSLLGLAAWAVIPDGAGAQAAIMLLVFLAGAWSASSAERQLKTDDPGPVVIDEVLGMLVTLFMNPVGWGGALVGFFVFRFFDVIKPYPANRLEHLRGGIGVMSDDLMAGIYANLVLRALLVATGSLGAAG